MMLDLETFRLRSKAIYPENCLQRKLIVLKQYDDFLEKNGLKPGLDSLNLWLDELLKRGLSNNTLRAYFYDVLSYFEIMMVEVDEKKLRLVKKRLPPSKTKEVDFLTEEEVARLINRTPSPIRKLIYAIMYSYGRRLGEVLLLTRKDVDLNKNTITFTILKKRSGERATYELEEWIKEMIIKYDKMLGRDKLFEITERAIEIAFKKDCKRAGIEPKGRSLRPHILRHSRISHLREAGVPLDVVSKFVARHSRFDTTVQFYRAVTEEEKVSIPKAEEVLKLKPA